MHLLNTLPQRLDPGATPTFAGLIAPSLTAPASTNLTLAGGTAGSDSVVVSNTLAASSAIIGAFKVGNGTAATNVAIGGGNINAGGTGTFGGAVTFGGNLIVAQDKFSNFDGSGAARMGMQAVSVAPYSVRMLGSADAANTRDFSFGYYTGDNAANAWNQKASINSYTGAATFAGAVTVSSTTAGSSGAGALVVAGGLSAAGASYFGGAVTANGVLSTTSRVGVKNAVTAVGAVASAALLLDQAGSINQISQISFGYTNNATLTNAPAYISYLTSNAAGNTAGDLIFGTRSVTTDTAPTERARIDSSGNLMVGVLADSAAGGLTLNRTNSANFVSIIQNSLVDGATHQSFQTNGSQKGYIATSGGITIFSTTSDYRMKENVVRMTGALDKVALLNPVTFDWVDSKKSCQGFIAHELQTVVPECVFGTKDAIDKEGKPVLQGVDTSFLVATLTAALQEAHGLIEDLATRISALETK